MEIVKMIITLLNFEFATLLFCIWRDMNSKESKIGIGCMMLLYFANIPMMWI